MRRQGPVITIGNFDGVHLGHQAILSRARQLADQLDAPLMAITFDPPPAHVVRPDLPMQSLGHIDQRVAKLKKAGADQVKVITPTPQWLHQAPDAFIQSLLDEHHITGMVEGDDFRFGLNRLGNVQMLKSLCESMGIAVDIVEPVEVLLNDQLITRVSSTLTRWLLSHGRVADAARCLGHGYELAATIIHGEKRGRTINIPTVNLDLNQLAGRALPADAVYAGWGILPDGSKFPAAISMGMKPTFAGHVRTLEAHLLGYDGDLYDQTVTLSFSRWMRHQQPFPSFAVLRNQLERDLAQIRKWAQRDQLSFDPTNQKAVALDEV
jgi:riboflavin kinase/FMN adenylyltransferase